MAAILGPGVDPEIDRDLRNRWNLGPDDPVPVSGEKITFRADKARGVAAKPRAPERASSNAGKIPVETLLPRNGPEYPGYGRPIYKGYGDETKQYGQQSTVDKIEKVAQAFAGQSLTPIYVGNIGQKGGGQYKPHKGRGHREGFGVDIRPSNNLGLDKPGVRWDSPDYNQADTMMMIHEIKRQDPNAVILFNDPDLIRMGLTKPAKNHDNHMHVDFK